MGPSSCLQDPTLLVAGRASPGQAATTSGFPAASSCPSARPGKFSLAICRSAVRSSSQPPLPQPPPPETERGLGEGILIPWPKSSAIYTLSSTSTGSPTARAGGDEKGSRCESGAGPLLYSARGPGLFATAKAGRLPATPLRAVSQKTCPSGDCSVPRTQAPEQAVHRPRVRATARLAGPGHLPIGPRRQEGLRSCPETVAPPAKCVHADRAAGGDRHHRRPHRPAAARRPEGPRGRRPHQVRQQPQAARPRRPQLRVRQPEAAAAHRLGRLLAQPAATGSAPPSATPARRTTSSRPTRTTGILTTYYENNTSVTTCPMFDAYPDREGVQRPDRRLRLQPPPVQRAGLAQPGQRQAHHRLRLDLHDVPVQRGGAVAIVRHAAGAVRRLLRLAVPGEQGDHHSPRSPPPSSASRARRTSRSWTATSRS